MWMLIDCFRQIVHHCHWIQRPGITLALYSKCSQVSPVFCHSSASVYYHEHKPKNKNMEEACPGTRLHNIMDSKWLVQMTIPFL